MPGNFNYPLRFDSNPLWWLLSGLAKGILGAIVLFGIAILVTSLFPHQLEVVETVIENSLWQSAGAGCLTWLAAVFLTPILIVSLIGIPVAILLWLALFMVVLYGLVGVANLAGEKVLRSAGARPDNPLVCTLVGVVLISAVVVPLNAISGGCLGTVLTLALVTPAIGAIALSRFGTLRWRPSSPGTPPPIAKTPPPPEPAPKEET